MFRFVQKWHPNQFLAIVGDISESNCNLRHTIEKTTLQDASCYVAFDLKCGNALFRLSGHSGKRACYGVKEFLP